MNTKSAESAPAASSGAVKETLLLHARPKIHPVVSYPFRHSVDYADLEELYRMLSVLCKDKERFARPITVMDRKTYYAMETNAQFIEFRDNVLKAHSDVLDAWCVDTCQMWYTGLGAAYEQGLPQDVYWMIPGDFNYGSPLGKDVLSRLHDLPESLFDLEQDFCIGAIHTDPTDSKSLVDTYGTYSLLFTWFPAEGAEIRLLTDQPRSEFFAVRHSFLREMLCQRWYPYEQTLVMLINAMSGKRSIGRFFVGDISDLPHGKIPLELALQQVERTERVLKMMWRERNQQQPDWARRYHELEEKSEQVRRSAAIILENLLGD